MSFKKNKYVVIREAVSKDLATFIYNYFLMKKQVYDTCLKSRYLSPYETLLGEYESSDAQVPNTYSNYADIVIEKFINMVMFLKDIRIDLVVRYRRQ